MKKSILALVIIICSLWASDVVHYDIRDTNESSISKPNHPSNDLYTNK
jgi:hypothetical protein